MKTRKIFGLALVVLFIIGMAVGCAPAPAPAAPVEENKAEAAPAPAPQAEEQKAEEPAPAPAEAKKFTIGFVIPGPDVYYNFGKEGVKWAVEATGNIYTERNSENNTVKEIQNIQDLIAAGVDGIIIMTTNAETGQKACELANEANIPIFLVDCAIADGPGKAQGQVQMELQDIGRLGGEYVAKNHPGMKYVILAGLPGQPGGEEQMQGFLKALEAGDPTAQLLSEPQYADWDRKKGEDLMRNYLVMHKDITMVYAMNEEMAYGAYTAIKDAGRENEMFIVSANGSAVGKEMIEAGTLESTVGWSPSEDGILCAIKCVDYLNGNPQEYLTQVPLDIYNKDNLDRYSNWDAGDMAEKYTPVLKEKGYMK